MVVNPLRVINFWLFANNKFNRNQLFGPTKFCVARCGYGRGQIADSFIFIFGQAINIGAEKCKTYTMDLEHLFLTKN
jgi:hypothetical protein